MNRRSPKAYARWAGALALALVVLGPFSMMYVPTALVVAGDATATAQKIIASEGLFRLGVLSDLVIGLIEVALIALLYVLLKPVSPTVSLMAALSRLAMVVVQGVNVANSIAVLLILTGGASWSAFTPGQLHALALLCLNTHEQVVHVWEAFFALHCVFLGWLIFRSGFVPRVFGPLMVLAATGYLTNSVGNLLLPRGKATFAAIVAAGAIFGELPFFLWLLFKGVDADAWHKLAAARFPPAPPTSPGPPAG